MTMTLTSEQEHLMQAFNCVVGARVATYVSGPITTGLRFFDWYISTGHLLESDIEAYRKVKYDSVLSLNESDIIRTANILRETTVTPVIEPASLHIASWNQRDYYHFWTELMRRLVLRVVVLDGWQYSIGCVIEFKHAIQFDIQIETACGLPLNAKNANKLILDAANDIELRGGSLDVLKRMAMTLRADAI